MLPARLFAAACFLLDAINAQWCGKGGESAEDCIGQHGSAMIQKRHFKDAASTDLFKRYEHEAPAECSAGSEVQQMPTESLATEETDLIKVVLADYPSTGSTWLKEMLSAISVAENAGNPSCSIYDEGSCSPTYAKDIKCSCEGFFPWQSAALIKSHFPAQELYMATSINSTQYLKTMDFGKVLQLVRHPVAAVMSNVNRWGGDVQRQSENLYCWGLWWERVKKTAGETGNGKVMVVRYEDLCLDTAQKMREILLFLGGKFATISLHKIEGTLSQHPELACMRDANDLYDETQSSSSSAEKINALFADNRLTESWGYPADGTALWSFRSNSSVSMIRAAGNRSMNTKQTMSLRNPWSTVWL